MNKTKKERIEMVEQNLEENKDRFKKGLITRKQFTRRKKDGLACIAEIKERKKLKL